MMPVRIDLEGFAELDAACAKAPELVREKLTAAMYEAELLLERAVQEKTPVGAYTNLKPSIAAQTPEIHADTVLGVVGTPVPYAIPVEMGTRPHFPPVESLIDWVMVKLGVPEREARGVAFLVARKISRTGTKAVGMFHRGFEENTSRVEQIFTEARRQIRDGLAAKGA